MIIWFYNTADLEAAAAIDAVVFIDEAHTFQHGRWTYRVDRTHHSPKNRHTHMLLKGKKMGVVNDDGSPSHGTNLNDLPKDVLDIGIRYAKKFSESASVAEYGQPDDMSIPSAVVFAARLKTLLVDRSNLQS